MDAAYELLLSSMSLSLAAARYYPMRVWKLPLVATDPDLIIVANGLVGWGGVTFCPAWFAEVLATAGAMMLVEALLLKDSSES